MTGRPHPAIATPASHLFEDAVPGRRLAELSDALELRDPLRRLALECDLPLLYHCEQSLLLPLDLASIRQAIERPLQQDRLRLLSFHAPTCYERPRLDQGMFHPGGRRLTRAEMLDTAGRNVADLRRILPGEVALAVENNNRLPTPAYDLVTEPEFLSELCRTARIDLLLDLPHACISAGNSGCTSIDYVGALPLEQVVQLHLSGYSKAGAVWRDTHAEPTAAQWNQAVGWIRQLPGLAWISLEYYGTADVLAALLARLRGVVEEER